MKHYIAPALWLLIVIVGLPQLSETVYTPALPDIAQSLCVSESWVEFTLTIFLIGFAAGTLIWGKLSDKLGRKPCLITGLILYIVGCIGCWHAPNIVSLLLSRFVQAFGGSTGSVLGQAICRDSFHGKQLGKTFSIIAGALAFSPATGPILGGIIDQFFGWRAIFLVLICIGILVLLAVYLLLPETHDVTTQSSTSMLAVTKQLIQDPRVIGFGILVAAANGIQFSYYAEGSFYLIELLGLTPIWYGISFIGIAAGSIAGSMLSRGMHDYLSSEEILQRGIYGIFCGGTLFVASIILGAVFKCTAPTLVTLTLLSMMSIMVGIGMMIPNALSLALENYIHAKGTAASLFGFFYYVLIALFTGIMGLLHNGTIFPMPFYFWFLSLLMLYASSQLVGIKHKQLVESGEIIK